MIRCNYSNYIIFESRKMIDKLNDYCQQRIINYLNLHDQISLWKATKDFSERLHANVCWAWRQKKFRLTGILFFFDNNPEVLDALLSTIGETVESLQINRLPMKHLQLLNNYKFPKVSELTYGTEGDEDITTNQNEVDLLAEIFPGLKSMTLINFNFWSISINNFKQLRTLQLSQIYNLHCLTGNKSVEELIIGPFANDYVCSTLKNFPKLQTLAICSEHNYSSVDLECILIERGNDIIELSFNDHLIHPGILQTCLKCLIRLTLINEKCTMEDLQFAISGMPMLEQLDLVDFQSLLTEIQLWKIVTLCPSLKILNISGIILSYGFFELSRHHMEQALENRSVPLTLHCHKIGTNRHLVSTTGSDA